MIGHDKLILLSDKTDNCNLKLIILESNYVNLLQLSFSDINFTRKDYKYLRGWNDIIQASNSITGVKTQAFIYF